MGGTVCPTIPARYAQRGESCVLRQDGFLLTAILEVYENEST